MSLGDSTPSDNSQQDISQQDISQLKPRTPSQIGDVTWEAAIFLPKQGKWRDDDFLRLHTNRMAELSNGRLEILPMTTWQHQMIVRFFMRRLEKHLEITLIAGEVITAVWPGRLFEGTIREPDLLFCTPANIPQPPEEYPRSADLILEVVSKGAEARQRDYEDKRIDYAKSGVSEYWIVDPQTSQITVLFLTNGQYETVGVFERSQTAISRYLPGFEINVHDALTVEQGRKK